MKRLTVFCPGLLAFFLFATSSVRACLCEPSSAEKRFADADLVVVGRAYETLANRSEGFVESERPETLYSRAYRFSVIETRKVPVGLNVESGITVLDQAVCPSNIGLGELFVLYANKQNNGALFLTNSCSGTEPAAENADSATTKCSHPHSAKDAISRADAVFMGFVLSGETDSHFESHLYHYRALVKDVWKNSQVGQVQDVFWQQTSGSHLHVGSGYRFLVRMMNGQYFHHTCLEVETSPKAMNIEERSRAVGRTEGEFDQLRLGSLQDDENTPAAEYASTRTGQLTSEVFSGALLPKPMSVSDGGASDIEQRPKQGGDVASRPIVTGAGGDRTRMSTSCSRCSIGTSARDSCSITALASAAILIFAFRRRTKTKINR